VEKNVLSGGVTVCPVQVVTMANTIAPQRYERGLSLREPKSIVDSLEIWPYWVEAQESRHNCTALSTVLRAVL
jgi:hypothetical protein